MTPRSRKPVMLLGINTTCPEANQTIKYKRISSLNEEDEDILHTPTKLLSFKIRRSKSDGDVSVSTVASDDLSHVMSKSSNSLLASVSLTNVFKEYLMQRNVLTSYPFDSSFASQPEDFGPSNVLQYIKEADMNESLLYCLDGNQPEDSSHLFYSDNDYIDLDIDNEDHDTDLMSKSKTKRKRSYNTVNNECDNEIETDVDSVLCKKVALDYFVNHNHETNL